MRSYGQCYWQYADSIEQLISFEEHELASINHDEWQKSLKKTLSYLKRNRKKYDYFVIKDVAVFVSKDNGYAVESGIVNPCLFEEEYDPKSDWGEVELSRVWRNAGRRNCIIDSCNNLIYDTVGCVDTVFYQMSMELDNVFPQEDYNYIWHACIYDCLTEEFQNYCTGESLPAEIANIVIPYLKQIRTLYPNMMLIKFCKKLPVKKE